MRRKKAFIHVVEIIIIALVVFILVIQFSGAPAVRADWERAELLALGNDMLSVMDRNGTNWLDRAQVSSGIDSLLSGTSIMYDVTVKNALKSNITVGCICGDSQLAQLSQILIPFTINGEIVVFDVQKIDPTRISFPVTDDVIFLGDDFFSQSNYDSYAVDMRSYLRRGGGLVEFKDFTQQSEIVFSSVQTTAFKLIFGTVSPTSGQLSFQHKPGDRFYNLVKYFHKITNSTSETYSGLHTSPHTFSPTGMLNANVKANASDSNRIILSQGSGAASMIVNEAVIDGSGRTVWMSAGSASLDERNVLVMAAFAWAAGEDYNIVQGFMTKPTSFSFIKVIPESNSYSGVGMYQPIEVIMSLGYIF